MDTIQVNIQEKSMEAEMATRVVSFVPKLREKLGWNDDEFLGYCVAKGISIDTAKKLLQGKTNINVQTLANLTAAFGLDDIGKVMNIEDNAQ